MTLSCRGRILVLIASSLLIESDVHSSELTRQDCMAGNCRSQAHARRTLFRRLFVCSRVHQQPQNESVASDLDAITSPSDQDECPDGEVCNAAQNAKQQEPTARGSQIENPTRREGRRIRVLAERRRERSRLRSREQIDHDPLESSESLDTGTSHRRRLFRFRSCRGV